MASDIKTSASEVAKYIIAQFHESEDLITNMKVQKLLYYIQGWHLGIYGTPVFDDVFEAWIHGPVQYNVYNEYKHYRWHPISEAIDKPILEESLVNHIEQVFECYGGETALALELLTHDEQPWLEARYDLASNEPSRNIISLETMQKYFAELAEKNLQTHNYTPNAETIKILQQSRRGIGVNTYSSYREMYKKLNLI